MNDTENKIVEAMLADIKKYQVKGELGNVVGSIEIYSNFLKTVELRLKIQDDSQKLKELSEYVCNMERKLWSEIGELQKEIHTIKFPSE